MGFWSGFEGLTGHQPGAFKGFSLKDILDDDLWKRRERLGGRQSRQFEETGVVPETAWYKGMGRPELMGPRVDAAGVPPGVAPVDPAAIARRRAGGFAGPGPNRLMDESPDMFAGVDQRRFDATTLANQQRRNALWGSGQPSTVRALRPQPNIQSQMLSNPKPSPAMVTQGSQEGVFGDWWRNLSPALRGNQAAIDFENTTREQVLVDAARSNQAAGVGRDRPFPISRRADIASQAEQNRLRAINSGNPAALRAAGIIPAMADKTTTTKSSAALDVPDVTTTVIKEKVPTGSAQWGNVQHPPNWQQRFDRRPVTFSSPTRPEGALSIMNMNRGLTSVPEDEIRRLMRELEGMRARRGY